MFSRVKTYIGVHGNEMADKVVKKRRGVPLQDTNIPEYPKFRQK
jgi:hypothetical protein